MKRLFTVLLAGMLLLTPSCDFVKSINPFGKKAREAEAMRQQQEALRVADSIKVAQEAAARERERLAEQARLAEQEAIINSQYHIVVGSFLTREYADAWLEHIRSFGYDARIVEMDGGRWSLVSAGSYGTLKEAWNNLNPVQEKIDSEAWVYRRE